MIPITLPPRIAPPRVLSLAIGHHMGGPVADITLGDDSEESSLVVGHFSGKFPTFMTIAEVLKELTVSFRNRQRSSKGVVTC